MLHIEKEKGKTAMHEKGKTSEESEQSEMSKSCAKVSLNACGHGEEEYVMSIVPVKVKWNKGNQIKYAFLDPGSPNSFCTTRLMHQLNMTENRTNILLRIMGQEKNVSSHVVTGLGVSELHGNTFKALPEFYTQKTMPVAKCNIPNQKDLAK